MRAVLLVPSLLLAACVAGGCASGSAGHGACGPVSREALDPGSIQHVLPGATPAYLTDPPTSGPHQPSPGISGARNTPIPKPQQVGILEGGDVLLQYVGLSSTDLRRVQSLAGAHVVVAPARSLPHHAHVVATSWLHKQSCGALDLSALRAFAHARIGKGPS